MQYQRNRFADTVRQPAQEIFKPLVARTENGMRARATTSNANVDLFASAGGMRGKDIIPAFVAAYNENKDYALRIAQWLRDVRGGAGERQLYRNIMLWLEANDPQTLLDSRLLENVAVLGRFDDLLIFKSFPVRRRALAIFAQALAEGNGLAAKWAPRKGADAVDLRRALRMTPRKYRKFIVSNTQVVEQLMCAKDWDEINYNHVPSVAMTRYTKAFARNDPEGYAAYKAALQRNDGTAKVNAGAVYPYDVLRMLGGARDLSGWGGRYSYGSSHTFNEGNLAVATEMWNNLPNWMNNKNVIAVCDNSGSMQSPISGSTNTTAMDVAVSLTMYTAVKSTGAFKNLSISFSDTARFCQHKGNLIDRMKAVCGMKWGGSTNLHSVFELILSHARRNGVPASDMPEMVVIFSDMQFNHCAAYDDSAFAMIRRKYEDAGYEMPSIVFWNLRDAGNKPVKFNEQGVALASGFSPSLMKSILAADTERFTPEAIMLATIGNDRYSW